MWGVHFLMDIIYSAKGEFNSQFFIYIKLARSKFIFFKNS